MPQDVTTGVSFRQALRFWFKLGCVSFGGPAGQVALMHDELVERRRWIDEPRFLRALSVCTVLPGPEAQQLATFVGYTMHGTRGALAAGGLFVLPSFVVLVALSWVYVAAGDLVAVGGAVEGLGAAVVALVVLALLRIGGRVLRSPAAVALAAASFAAMLAGVPFPLVIACAALVGLGARRAGVPLGASAGDGPAPSDPPPPGAWRGRAIRTLVVWLVPLGALLVLGGLVADLAGFFTLAALITFGGAYAVLPFVADASVNHFGWLSAEDMVAGLALGESTPGPLIMVNTFVGFLAGEHVGGGPGWGILGAAVATAATFAPSFVMILNGAPLVDRIHPRGYVAAAMAAVTAAVVGAIGGLAVFVGRHALADAGRPDPFAIVLALAAFAALRFGRLSAPLVIAAAAAAGIAQALTT